MKFGQIFTLEYLETENKNKINLRLINISIFSVSCLGFFFLPDFVSSLFFLISFFSPNQFQVLQETTMKSRRKEEKDGVNNGEKQYSKQCLDGM